MVSSLPEPQVISEPQSWSVILDPPVFVFSFSEKNTQQQVKVQMKSEVRSVCGEVQPDHGQKAHLRTAFESQRPAPVLAGGESPQVGHQHLH
jgi:hypothetical protein